MSANPNAPRTDRLGSKPIPIAPSAFPRGARARSMSLSSESSGGSPTELPPTPVSPKMGLPSPTMATSPILSYFLAQSPGKTPGGTFPFRKFGPAPVFEEDEGDVKEVPATHHARRASTAVAERLANPGNPAALPDAHQERGHGVMRRLSLSSAFMNPEIKPARSPPNAPPNSAVSPTQGSLPFGRDNPHPHPPRRAATLSSGEGRPRRAPSPMGERILKGHFDGFN